ncbi:DUF3561 family protein [Sodalis-like endosymbiont of Proechinophthirus fluctus]|uniref:DUF3561 family protein n=1 Tax=Sodalis-like endosymbiont of Proechinophthirus fluctus TaxID=1462730 RepID=UPI00083441E5
MFIRSACSISVLLSSPENALPATGEPSPAITNQKQVLIPNVTEIKCAIPLKFSLAPDRKFHWDETSCALWGGMVSPGLFFTGWLFAVPILQFGANSLFFLLYTWLFSGAADDVC